MRTTERKPEWLEHVTHGYYTNIETRGRAAVAVCRVARDQEISETAPGRRVLELRPRLRRTRIVDVDGRERGCIRSEGLVPGIRFVMRHDADVVWTLAVRSVLRKRHRLEMSDGVSWTFKTPFYWWQHLTGTIGGSVRLVGGVGPSTAQWGFFIHADQDDTDALAAVAFMHWKWWRW